MRSGLVGYVFILIFLYLFAQRWQEYNALAKSLASGSLHEIELLQGRGPANIIA